MLSYIRAVPGLSRALGTLGLLAGLLAPAALGAQTPAAVAEPVALSPGDVVRVTVWGDETLSGELLVDESGMAVFPVLGPRRVAGIPVTQLRESLYREYQQQLRNPAIEIVPLRRVYVLGEVRKPGMVTVDPTTPLAGAIALAEGPTLDADLNRIRVTRDGKVIRSDVPAESIMSSLDVRSGDQIFVRPRPWLRRNTAFLVNTGVSATLFIISLLLRDDASDSGK